MRFNPDPNQTVVIAKRPYTVQAHPQAPRQPFSAEGKRAIVYRMTCDGTGYALKVFKKQYRNNSLLTAADRLKGFAGVEGLRAAERTVVSADDEVISVYPELLYAMLMPWISGTTYYDTLIKTGQDGTVPYTQETAICLCTRFLSVMAQLESWGLAHTDVSPGNVILDSRSLDVQLLDLEDLFVPGLPAGGAQNVGTLGYRHPSTDSHNTTACSAGDRYATAIFAGEIILLSNPAFAKRASDTGVYGGDRNDQAAAQIFQEAHGWLASFLPGLAELVGRAWESETLEACPRIQELHGAIAKVSSPVIAARLNAISMQQRGRFPIQWSIPTEKSEQKGTLERHSNPQDSTPPAALNTTTARTVTRIMLQIGAVIIVLILFVSVWYWFSPYGRAHRYYARGSALTQKQDWDSAIAEFRKAAQIYPDDVWMHPELGSALGEKGDWNGAIAEFRKAIELKPDNADAHINLGWALRGKGDTDGAIIEERKALAIDPKQVLAHENLGSALGQKGDWDGAIAEFRKATQLNPGSADAHVDLGWALGRKGDRDGDIAEDRKALEIDSKHVLAHANLGLELGGKGDWDAAITEFRKATQLNPGSADAHVNLGWALGGKGNLDGAAAEYREALRLKPDSVLARTNLESTLAQQRNGNTPGKDSAVGTTVPWSELQTKLPNGLDTENRPMSVRTGEYEQAQFAAEYINQAKQVTFSLSGQLLAALLRDGSAIVGDLPDGRQIQRFKTRGGFLITLSRDAKRVATASEAGIDVWEVSSGSQLAHTATTDSTYDLAFSPDSSRLAIATWRGLSIWNLGTKQLSDVGDSAASTSAAWSPDARYVASAGGDTKIPNRYPATVRLWDTQRKLARIFSSGSEALAFSPDGALLASGGEDRKAIVREAETGRSITVLSGFSGKVRAVRFSPDGELLAVGAWGELRLYRTRDWSILQTIPQTPASAGSDRAVNTITFSSDGAWIAIGGQEPERVTLFRRK